MKCRQYGGVTGLHSFTYGVLKVHSLIYDCACVLKFSSNEHVFERLCFLYDTIGGCGKITLSSGWFWIKYQFFNSISLTFGAAGLPVFDNKWQNLLACFGLLLQNRTSVVKAHFSQGIVDLSFLVASGLKACFKIFNLLLKICS